MLQVRTSVSAMLLVLAFAVSPLHAQYVEIYRLDNAVKGLPEQEVLSQLATHLGISLDAVKQEKADSKVSVGQLYVAQLIAKLTKSDFKTVMAEFKSGKAWGVIAKERKIEMDQLSKDAKELENALKKTQRASQ